MGDTMTLSEIAELSEGLELIERMVDLQNERGDIPERRKIIATTVDQLVNQLMEVRKNYG